MLHGNTRAWQFSSLCFFLRPNSNTHLHSSSHTKTYSCGCKEHKHLLHSLQTISARRHFLSSFSEQWLLDGDDGDFARLPFNLRLFVQLTSKYQVHLQRLFQCLSCHGLEHSFEDCPVFLYWRKENNIRNTRNESDSVTRMLQLRTAIANQRSVVKR